MEKSEKFWDRLAKGFNSPNAHLDENHIKTIEKLRQYLTKNQSALDYGCATGMIAIDIAGDVKDILGIDISSKMISFAEKNALDRKIQNIQFKKCTLFDSNLEDSSLDVILAFNILHLLPDLQNDIHKIGKLLKPGGIFISSSACMGEKRTVLSIFFTILTKLKIIPHLNIFGFTELENDIKSKNFTLLETEREFEGKYSHLIIAKKTSISTTLFRSP